MRPDCQQTTIDPGSVSRRRARYSILFAILAACSTGLFAEAPAWFPGRDNTDIGGYIKELGQVWVRTYDRDSIDLFNLVHFRTNARWHPWSVISTEVAGRLLLFSGSQFGAAPQPQLQLLGADQGYVDLTRTWPSVLVANVDRAYASVNGDNLTVTAGRQRINWGTSFVWNPNDWFNAFNFLDFDYEERPGTDGIRFQYYLGPLTMAEVAIGAGHDQRDRTYAVLYRFNRWSYDVQLQAGLVGVDGAFGGSWAGYILDGGFRGEIAWFQELLEDDSAAIEDNGNIVAVASYDYTFANSLFLHGELLYNGFGTRGEVGTLAILVREISAKNLIPSRYAIFAEASYTFTPLVSGRFSVSTNPSDFSFYAGPSLSLSLSTNLDLIVLAQIFSGDQSTLYGELPDLFVSSLRWSF